VLIRDVDIRELAALTWPYFAKLATKYYLRIIDQCTIRVVMVIRPVTGRRITNMETDLRDGPKVMSQLEASPILILRNASVHIDIGLLQLDSDAQRLAVLIGYRKEEFVNPPERPPRSIRSVTRPDVASVSPDSTDRIAESLLITIRVSLIKFMASPAQEMALTAAMRPRRNLGGKRVPRLTSSCQAFVLPPHAALGSYRSYLVATHSQCLSLHSRGQTSPRITDPREILHKSFLPLSNLFQ